MKQRTKRPFVWLCTGMSLDGKISSGQRVCTKITADDDRNFLYDHRVLCDAVMIGGRTLLLDDSGLTVKSVNRQRKRLALGKPKEPIKIAVISDIKNLKTNGDFFNKGEAKKIIFTTTRSSKTKIVNLQKKCDVYVYGQGKVSLKKALKKLRELKIKSLMVEGGGELIFSLLKDNLVDEINLKIGNLILGGRNAPTLADGEGFTGQTAKKVKLISLKRKNNYLMLKYKLSK